MRSSIHLCLKHASLQEQTVHVYIRTLPTERELREHATLDLWIRSLGGLIEVITWQAQNSVPALKTACMNQYKRITT